MSLALRNIGISAHIDSGKTTLTERILFYTDRIHAMHEVRGKDGIGAAMDSMELEKERGITIQSAATNTTWRDTAVNIIDTPGHVDFTMEVERALRVLDGAVMVLCAVGGVQSQSITVDRQMKRYSVPRIAFVNKCDRTGADPEKVTTQLRDQLGLNAVQLQISIGLEEALEGVVDLIAMKAVYFDGQQGQSVRVEEIPQALQVEARAKREEMLDRLSICCDDLTEAILEENVTEDVIRSAIRKAVLNLSLVPVLMGSAYKNKGVQPLLDAVVDYLPSPSDVRNVALDRDQNEREVELQSESDLPTVVHAFKLEDGRFGQLTYVRIYQGSLAKGMEMRNTRNGRDVRVSRLVRMHASNMEEIGRAGAGDIVALFGIPCASGDTFTSHGLQYSLTSMFVPNPVISLAVRAPDKQTQEKLSKAIGRFCREDATFRSFVDPESKQTIIQGMGELHLDVYLTRIKREYGIGVEVGKPQVAYRESVTRRVEFNFTHKKQTGGAGQYARVAGMIEPHSDGEYEFVDEIKGGAIPREYIPACDKGFRECLQKGSMIGFPITGVRVTINDGAAHSVDSSEVAFRSAAVGAFREKYWKAHPVILEPVMRVSVEGPEEYQGAMLASLNQRRGVIIGVTDNGSFMRVDGHVPLAEMFGYSTILRSATQGKAEFSMEFAKYQKVPESVSEELKKAYAEKARDSQGR